MSPATLSPIEHSTTFPAEEVKRRLRKEFQDAAEDGLLLRPAWQPLIDSLRMVSVVVTLESLLGFKLPPEKLVKKGGCTSVDEAVEYTFTQLQRLWNDRSKRKERS